MCHHLSILVSNPQFSSWSRWGWLSRCAILTHILDSRIYILDSTSKSSRFSQQVGGMWEVMPTKNAAANSLHWFAEYDLPRRSVYNCLNFILLGPIACEPMLKERSFFTLFRTVSRSSAASCLLNHYLHFPRTCNCSQVSFLFLKIITHCSR